MNSHIVKYPNKILRETCVEFNFDDPENELEILTKALKMSCMLLNGYGLAAPQLGIAERLFFISPLISNSRPNFFFNPVIRDTEGESQYKEGCLSIPNVWAWVKRPNRYIIEAYNENNEKFELVAENVSDDPYWTAILHEYDHLDGKLFIDHLDPFEKRKVQKSINKLRSKKNSSNTKTSHRGKRK